MNCLEANTIGVGADQYCPAKALACGNGADRTMHPVELFGEDWDSFDNSLSKPLQIDCRRQTTPCDEWRRSKMSRLA
ncbi:MULTISPECIES: DUF3079 domain-containing protein [Pseudomonas]|uniref:DUF3079 domain-containing protein n=1 Tax=Pseudomonas TaxID=286 RepID=UPI000CD468C2|nr:DUF3079 domain-containing protein [Pseudomonas putida]